LTVVFVCFEAYFFHNVASSLDRERLQSDVDVAKVFKTPNEGNKKRPKAKGGRGSFLATDTPVTHIATPMILVSNASNFRLPDPIDAPFGDGPSWDRPSSMPLPPSQWLDDIDTTSAITCGKHKCLFESRASQHRDQGRHGYLVAQQNRHKTSFEDILNGYQWAQELAARFSIRHLFTAATMRANCTEDLAGGSRRTRG
jgi:hypothetical protein